MPDNKAEVTAAASGIQIIRAGDVSVPIMPTERETPPEVARLQEEFLAGKDLNAFELKRLIIAGAEGGGGNGNCNIC